MSTSNWTSLGIVNSPDDVKVLARSHARLLLDTGIGAEFECLFGHVDGRKQSPAAKHIIENLSLANDFSRDEKCSICLKEFELNSTIELSCHHRYCENCIIRWLKLVNTCPMCRIEFPTDDQDYEQYKIKNNLK